MKCIQRITTIIVVLLASSALSLRTQSVWGADIDYPIRPIIINVGFAQGGSAGIGSQIFAESAKKYLPKPQSILVNFKPGAAQAVAAEFVLQQSADGHNLLWADTGLIGKMAQDSRKLHFKKEDFSYIGTVVMLPNAFTVKKESQFKTLENFIDYAKKHPGQLSYGSAGIGGVSHINGEIIQKRLGIKLNHIPFTGGGPAMTAVLGGHIDCYPGALVTVLPHLQPGGGLRALAILGPERAPDLPDVPTIVEKGYKMDLSNWHFLAVSKETPPSVFNILVNVFQKTTGDPLVKESLTKMGFVPVNWGPENTKKRVYAQFEEALVILKELGLEQ